MSNKTIHTVTPLLVTLFFVITAVAVALGASATPPLPAMGMIAGYTLPTLDITPLVVAINATITILAALLFTKIAATFNLLKEKSLTPLLFYLLFSLLHTTYIGCWAPQQLIIITIGIAMALLYTAYQGVGAVEKGFLIALLFAVSSMFYARILYILPLFLLGFVQMKAFSWRIYAAILVGLITPYWILWGVGWVDASQFQFQALALSPELPQPSLQHIPAVATMLIGLFTGIAYLHNAYNDKVRMRAMNGFVNLLSGYTTILMFIDHTHYAFYWPLLNACVALQASYLFTSQQSRSHTILFYTLTLLLTAGVVWSYWG